MPVSFDTYRVTGMYRFAIQLNSAGAVAETAIPFSNGATFKNDIKTIAYEGDGQKAKKFLLEQVDVEVKADEIGAAALQAIYAKTAVTASLPADATVRLYFGDNGDSSGINCGVAAYCTAEKLSSGANVKLRIVAPRGTLGSPRPPTSKAATRLASTSSLPRTKPRPTSPASHSPACRPTAASGTWKSCSNLHLPAR